MSNRCISASSREGEWTCPTSRIAWVRRVGKMVTVAIDTNPLFTFLHEEESEEKAIAVYQDICAAMNSCD